MAQPAGTARWWRSKRRQWKTASTVLNVDRHAMKITNTGVWKYEIVPLNHPHVFTPKMYLNPVPQDVIDQNPKIVQNLGY